MSTKSSLCQRKTEGGPGKGLANLWSRKRITKKACAGRGQETKWEMSVNYHSFHFMSENMYLPGNIQQVSDDPDLLNLMMNDLRGAPDLYKPGNYWKTYEALFLPELMELGLRDFRRRRNSVLCSFGAVDESPSMVGFYSRPCGYRPTTTTYNVNPLKNLFWRLVLRFKPISRRLRDRSLFTGLTLDGVRRLSFEYAKYYGMANGAAPLDKAEASVIGNPFDVFTIAGKTYTTSFLDYYLNYAYCCRYVDFHSVGTIAELGCGLGRQTEVIRKLHPRICHYLFDIPPQLYVCEQYLSSLFPGAVVSYRSTRALTEMPPPKEGSIFIFGSWKLAEMAGLRWDLFWNAGSFQEMEPDLVLNYLSFVNRNTRNYVYLHEAMKGMAKARKPGEVGVLNPTTLEHYRQGLADFELTDLSDFTMLPSLRSEEYSRSFWKRKKTPA